MIPVGGVQSEMQAKMLSEMKRWSGVIWKSHTKPN